MTDPAAQEIWRRHLRRVAAAARAWRKAHVTAALANYDRVRDLPKLLRLPGAWALTARDAARALRVEARRQARARREGDAALGPQRMARLMAALIAERRG